MKSPDHVFIVYTECEPGREDEFNRWYDEVHVPDLLTVQGVTAIQRFELSPHIDGEQPNRWLSICEIEGDLDAMRASLAAKGPEREMSPYYLRGETVRHFFTAITPRRESVAAATQSVQPGGERG